MDFKDWQIFKTENVLPMSSLLTVVYRDGWTVGSRSGSLTTDAYWSEAVVD